MTESRWRKLAAAGDIAPMVHEQAVLKRTRSTPRELGGRELYSGRNADLCSQDSRALK